MLRAIHQWIGGLEGIKKVPNKFLRAGLIIAGTFFVFLGVLGIFLPVLPTTPFLLLAAAAYARSSEHFYYWLLHNKWFGNYIKNYREGKGISMNIKIWTVAFLWITILVSTFFVEIFPVRIFLLLVAVMVSIHIFSIKTFRE